MLILSIWPTPAGTYTTTIDLYYNLKKYFPGIKFKTLSHISISEFFLRCIKNFGKDKEILSSYSKETYIEDDIIITTAKTFYTILNNKIQCKIKCKNLILLDTWNLYLCEKENTLNEFWELVNSSCDNIITLSNPAQFNRIKGKFYEYYTCFSPERLEIIKPKKHNNKIYVRGDILKSKNTYCINNNSQKKFPTFKNVFECKEYHYYRWDHGNKIHFENIGKMIFEFIYFNKKVKYYPYKKFEDDGLTYYLKLFNIDDNKKQYLNINKIDIINKLFFNKYNILLDILNGL